MSQNEPAIIVKDVKKSFRIPLDKKNGIKQLIVNIFKRKKGYREFTALNGVSFEIKKGEFFGIVGRNGSGKSTLLKMLAGVYTPDSGAIAVNGTLTPFIELGVGFNPELTGRENVFLNGALLGFSREEMEKMYNDIVDFAELHDFMEERLKNYSSGMQVRLAFSIAIRANSDILLLDEVLAVGDEAFQRKCEDFFDKVKKDKTKTVILVTHSMDSVRKYCSKAILIDNGKIKIASSPEDVANEYSLDNTAIRDSDKDQEIKTEYIKNVEVEMLSTKIVDEKTPVELKISYQAMVPNSKIVLNLIDSNRQVPLYVAHSKVFKDVTKVISQTFQIVLDEINDTNIHVALSIRDANGDILAFLPEHKLPSLILRRKDYIDPNRKSTYAVLFERGEWR